MSQDETRDFRARPDREVKNIDEVIAEYLQAVQSGDDTDMQVWLDRYPELADELREFFADREQFEQMAQPMREAVNAPAIGSQVRYIGDYELLDELGRGGMGVVYKAQQVSLKRLVALKMILSGEHASEQDLSRFRAEVEAIAKLQHPHIVQIHEIGEHEGNPYAALEYVEGGSLADQLDGTPLSSQRATALIETLARAVHVAHQEGIIHRDLKPANVLMTVDGQPKITDFGLAKLIKEESHKTRTGAILGTPSYMAPEQAEGKNTDIGPATDVYALGAILYELLTGRPPFRAESTLETIKQVALEEPVPPRLLQSNVPRDLETICLKCLQKEQPKRYDSSHALADDLRRFLNHEPIHARPVRPIERAWRWCRRNPAVASLLLLVVVSLLTGIVVSTHFAIRATQEANIARQERDEKQQLAEKEKQERNRAEWLLYASQLQVAQQHWKEGNAATANEVLNATRVDFRGWEHRYLYTLFHHRGQRTFGEKTPGSKVRGVAVSSDGARIVSTGDVIKVWDAHTGLKLHTLTGHQQSVFTVAFSPDGQRIVTGDNDRTIKVWNVHTGNELLSWKAHRGGVRSLAFSPDGQRIVSGSDTVKVWNAHTGQLIRTCRGQGPTFAQSVAFSPDGRRFAAGYENRTIKVWNADAGFKLSWKADNEKTDIHGANYQICSVAFSPDGNWLISGDGDKRAIKIWDANTGQLLRTWQGHDQRVNAITISPDGRYIASGSQDKTVRIWDSATGRELHRFRGHTNSVASVTFHPDGQRLVSLDSSGILKMWNLATGQQPLSLARHSYAVSSVAFTPDGQRILSGSVRLQPKPNRGELRISDAETGQELITFQKHTHAILSVAVSPDGQRFISRSYAPTLKICAIRTGQEILALESPESTGSPKYTQDGERIVVPGGWNKPVNVLDGHTGRKLLTLKSHLRAVSTVAISPDGNRIASTSSMAKEVIIWNAHTGEKLLTIEVGNFVLKATPVPREDGGISSIAFSPDGQRIVTGVIGDHTVRVWDSHTGQELLILEGHTYPVTVVAFHPDGERIFSASDDRTLKVWNANNGLELLTLKSHSDGVKCLAVSPSGNRVVTGSRDQTVLVWDAHSPEKEQPSRWIPASHWYRQQAQLCEENKQWFAVAFHLEQLLKSYPWDSSLHIRRAKALERLDKYPQALTHHLQAIFQHPKIEYSGINK